MTSRRVRPSAPLIALAPPTRAWLRAVPGAPGVVHRAARAAVAQGLEALPARHPLRGRMPARLEISVALVGDAAMRRLNRRYRRQDRPTNVLSFPAGREAWPLLGDVVIAAGVACREARGENKTVAAHLAHLVVHGVLHLLGYDHHRDRDAARMERLESAIMARLGLPDPYGAARGVSSHR
jgi:probable rRNA maturation factor